MASITYCRLTRLYGCHRVEQVMLLFTTFLVCTSGIRNNAPQNLRQDAAIVETSSGFEERAPYHQATPIDYDSQRPSASLAPQSALTNNANYQDFKPSQQILDFTLSDAASSLQNYPPSYLESAPNGYTTGGGTPNGFNILPPPQQHEQLQPVANKRYNIEDTDFNNFNNTLNGASTVPSYIQTTPIHSYRDPFTYQNYQASTVSSKFRFQDNDNDIIYHDHGQKGSPHQREDAPQAYTVQSTLLVGNNPNHNDVDRSPYRPLASPNNEYKRPGYVFDEQFPPNYISNNNNKFKQQHHHQQQQHLSTLPATIYDSDGSRQRPSSPQRLSYDSHDYPPPSYYQGPTYQQQEQQQQQKLHRKQYNEHSTYFQTPQRQDIGFNSISQPTEQFNVGNLNVGSIPTAATISTPSTFSNYANNFDNYLFGDASQQHSQYYPNQHLQKQQQQHQQQQQQYLLNYRPSYPTENYNPHQNHPQAQQLRPPYPGYRPPQSLASTQAAAQKPSNYYEYQLGEIPPPPPRRPTPPPSPHNYPNYPLQRPTSPPSGLASLASLFTTTQQYAPQFTNLLLGALTGGGGGGGGGGSSAPSIPNRLSEQQQQQQQQKRPINMQLIKALENIARNDDLQCVPKVLCQTIAGQTQRGQLPSFITSPAITNFLAGFPAASPALIYGRAALLGISGGERSCAQTYAKCPKSEFEILHYLNNHRGGFFKFFSEPEEQPATSSANAGSGNYDDSSSSGGNGVSSSLFSILSALTGNPTPTQKPKTTTTTTQRPATSTLDIAGGIGNFFTQVLSDYLSGVEYQRRRRNTLHPHPQPHPHNQRQRQQKRQRRRRRNVDAIESEIELTEAQKILKDEDFHDEEDNDDADDDKEFVNDEQYDDVEARILHKDEGHANFVYPKFFPEDQVEQVKSSVALNEAIQSFNVGKTDRKLKFPNTDVDDRYPSASWISFKDSTGPRDQNYEGTTATQHVRRGKRLQFNEEVQHNQVEEIDETRGQRIIFPDHYEKHIRKGRILNRPDYAAQYGDYVRTTADDNEGFRLSNSHRGSQYLGTSTATTHYYTQTNSKFSTSSSSSYGANVQETGFRPTPIPISSSYTDNNIRYDYPNNNYVSNNRYSSNDRRFATTTTTTRRPRHEDDPNIYVTNGHGITEFYVTPDGRKIYL